jgi:hypothetical protein
LSTFERNGTAGDSVKVGLQCRNGTDRRKLIGRETNLSRCYFIHDKSERDWRGIELGHVVSLK